MTSLKKLTNKVGIAAYRRDDEGTITFLVHLPKPKEAGDELNMKWGVARGTVAYVDEPDNDIRNSDDLQHVNEDQIEDHWETALREAEEELGVVEADIVAGSMRNHGLIDYHSEHKAPYAVHFYSVQIKADRPLDTLKNRAIDSQDITWKTLSELEKMVDADTSNAAFKEGYISILTQIADEL